MNSLAHFVFIAVAVLSSFYLSTAITCYKCENCEENFDNDTFIQECKPKENMCIKMVLMNGNVDRKCGDNKRCEGRSGRGSRKRRAVRDDGMIWDFQFLESSPHRRFVRQLLGPPAKTDTDPKSKTASSIHCCDTNTCNKSPGTVHLKPGTLLGSIFILAAVTSSLTQFA